MALQRSYARQLMLSLFDKEATYGAGAGGWSASSACLMMDYEEDSGLIEWDDLVVQNNDVLTSREMVTHQELVRQSSRITYQEPRTKPNTLAGLLGLVLGSVASTQDGSETAYRHKITKASSIGTPSIAAQAKFEGGDQREFRGMKGSQATLSFNGPYLQLSTELIGSGYRVASATAFPVSVSENWLRVGDCKLWLKDTGGTPITTSGAPTQGAANLGGSEVDFSTRLRSFSWTWMNALAAEAGYRASTGMLRADFHPVRRTSTMTIQFDCTTETEAADLTYYLSQSQLAAELNCDSGVLVDSGGLYKFGAILIIPRLQILSLRRSQVEELEVLTLECNTMDDLTNSEVIAYVYNAKPAYLV
jgi:hypothetical protein